MVLFLLTLTLASYLTIELPIILMLFLEKYSLQSLYPKIVFIKENSKYQRKSFLQKKGIIKGIIHIMDCIDIILQSQ